MTIEKRDLPLRVLQEFKQLKYDCHDFQILNADILTAHFENLSIYLQDSTSSGKFYFSITQPRLDANNKNVTNVHVTFKPRNTSDPKEHSMMQPVTAIAQILSHWNSLVRAYHEISLDINDRFLEQYESSFFSQYKVLDSHADTKPFDDQHQKLLEYTLEGFEQAIEVIDVPLEAKQEILMATSVLKNSIPALTKNQVVRGLAKITAKIKLKGYAFFTSFYEELPKTLSKIFAEKGVHYVLEQIPKLLHHFLP